MKKALLGILPLLLLASPVPSSAAETDRSAPPAPGPAVPYVPPVAARRTLSNGLQVLLVERHALPIVSVVLAVRGGAASDPRGSEGLAAATAAMLDEGAAGRGSLELDDAASVLGAHLDTAASWDAVSASIFVPAARLGPALDLLADVALRPDFPESEWKRVRAELLNDFLMSRTSPGAVASAAVQRAVFGPASRYGTPARGTAASVAKLTREQMVAFHRSLFRPGAAAIVVVGDTTPDSLLPLLEKAFGAWPAGGSAPAPLPAPAPLKGRTLWLVDRPDAAQSAIRVGGVAPRRDTPDWVGMEVVNTLLGGSFTSRLNDNLREKKGYTYGARSFFDLRRSGGLFAAASDVQTDVTAPAVTEFVKELKAIRTRPTDLETDRARSYLALSFATEWESVEQIATKLAEAWVYGLPEATWTTYAAKALAVTGPEMEAIAKTRIDPSASAFVVVGDRKKVEGPLKALGLGEWKVLSVDDVLGPAPKGD